MCFECLVPAPELRLTATGGSDDLNDGEIVETLIDWFDKGSGQDAAVVFRTEADFSTFEVSDVDEAGGANGGSDSHVSIVDGAYGNGYAAVDFGGDMCFSEVLGWKSRIQGICWGLQWCCVL